MTQFAWPVRVYYEDADAGGVVYHANYLKFMERARTEWLRALGFEQDEVKKHHNVLFVVRHMDIEFIAPARFNDSLVVDLTMQKMRGASIILQQTIKREHEQSVLCQAEVRIVSISANEFKPCPIPEQIRKLAK